MEIPKTPDLLRRLDEYVAYVPEGVKFLDPLYHEPIEAGQPPRCLREHPRIGAGFEELRSLACDGNLQVQLVIALHGQSSDFTDALAQCDFLHAADAAGIEANWVTQSNSPLPKPVISGQHGRREFQQAQINWLRTHGSLVLPCEYFADDDSQDPLTKKMNALWGIYEEASSSPNQHDQTQRNIARNLAFCACQSVRQWAILGQFGYLLSCIEYKDNAPANHDVPLMLGVGHEMSEHRLRDYLGVPVQATHVQHARLAHMPQVLQYRILCMRMFAQGYATLDQLAMPFGF